MHVPRGPYWLSYSETCPILPDGFATCSCLYFYQVEFVPVLDLAETSDRELQPQLQDHMLVLTSLLIFCIQRKQNSNYCVQHMVGKYFLLFPGFLHGFFL